MSTKFKVTMSHWNGETKERETVFFDAAAFEFVDSHTGPVVVFTTHTGRKVGAIYGFDYIVELVDTEGEEQKLKEYWVPSEQPEQPDTMAA
jgi:hypothetical protein